jgi:hypothetical protein
MDEYATIRGLAGWYWLGPPYLGLSSFRSPSGCGLGFDERFCVGPSICNGPRGQNALLVFIQGMTENELASSPLRPEKTLVRHYSQVTGHVASVSAIFHEHFSLHSFPQTVHTRRVNCVELTG